MPEVLEVELTRRGVEHLARWRVDGIERTDPLVVQPGIDDMLVDSVITGFDRRGKQLVMLTDGPTVGVHLGMTGRILVDDHSAVGGLTYGSRSDHSRWDRWVVRLGPPGPGHGVKLRLHDPRRLGRVVNDPDIGRLGPDALSLRRADVAGALRGRRAPLKAVLLDQQAIAGLGNMLVDEVLWWSGLDPRRPAGSLGDGEVVALHGVIGRRLRVMLRRGGSHTGTLSAAVRAVGGMCRRDGTPLARSMVGGRTTVWCPGHQR